ncbi:MAG: DUF349 domain-containing protein [Bacteroidota bacterium]
MKKRENTDQNPELDNTLVPEENSSIIPSVTDMTNESAAEAEMPTEVEPIAEITVEAEIDEKSEAVEEIPIEVEVELQAESVEEIKSETDISLETVAETEIKEGLETSVEMISTEVNPTVEEISESVKPEQSMEILPDLPEIKGEIFSEHDDEIPEEILEQEAEVHEVNYDQMTRAELLELMEKAVEDANINAVKTTVALIKVAFLKKKKEENLHRYEAAIEGGDEKAEVANELDELDAKFDEVFNIYKSNKAKYNEEQERIKSDNLKRKQKILDELRLLINSEETLKKTYDEFKTLQERWKEIGMVPRNDISNLWQNYHFLVEKFFEKVKLNKELKDLDLRKNMEAKIALCEKTEELLLETSALRSFKKLQKYHEEWKELGPVPADKKEEIWERFKNASDKINDGRRAHYAQVDEEQQKNLETKVALSEQAEEVMGLPNESIRDWQNNTNKVNELLKIWKSVGSVPQKQNNEIWNRFKSALDAFFANKKEYFDKLKEQQVNNYNLKVDLCLQAESMKNSTDWKKTTNDLIHFQNEWKNIGPVPKKHSDKIWKRFRSACDEFFKMKSEYFNTIQSHEEENLKKKLDLIVRLKEHEFGSDKSQNLGVLKGFQREWTEIGHIPIKEKDRLHNEFRALVNEHLDKLKISEVEMSTLNYQNRVESMLSDPQSKRLVGREKETLSGKINQMKEDINLWENNIGFLSKSKNAALLKEEFEKKINKAKSEVKVMEAKLKMLRQQ